MFDFLIHQRNSALWLEKYSSEILKKKIVQENWYCVCRNYVLGDNFTFYFWTKIHVENHTIRTFLLYVMIWLVLYAQKKTSTTYLLSKHSLGSNCARCISEKIYCAKSLCNIYDKKVCFPGQILTYEKIRRDICYVFYV